MNNHNEYIITVLPFFAAWCPLFFQVLTRMCSWYYWKGFVFSGAFPLVLSRLVSLYLRHSFLNLVSHPILAFSGLIKFIFPICSACTKKCLLAFTVSGFNKSGCFQRAISTGQF